MKFLICVASYNEKENISKLIPLLDAQFKKFPKHAFTVLVIDGNSPDGTGAEVLRLAKTYKFLKLLPEKEKAGLGAAYMFGFATAMEEYSPDYIFEMDADMQHDPKDLGKFIKAIEGGADYVIGSRFVKDGSIPKKWGLYRKSLSIGGSYFAKICLWIFAVNDFTSGYKATRVKGYLDKVDLNTIRSKGFAYKIDLLYRIHRLGARIEEVPIKFGLRDRGDSKMERNNMLDSLKVVLSIRLKESANFIKFVVVGFIGLATDLSVFNLLRISMSSANSSYLSGAVAMIVTYLFNNFWSFNDRKISSNTNLVKRFPVYALSSLIPIVARSLLIKSGVARFGDTALVANILFLVGVTFGVIWNFTVYSKFIWKAPNK